MLSQMQSGGNKALSFGKSRAKLLTSRSESLMTSPALKKLRKSFQEILSSQEPQKFQKLGRYQGRPMMGPPNRQDFTARAIAGEQTFSSRSRVQTS